MATRIIRWKVFKSSQEFVDWQQYYRGDIEIIAITPILCQSEGEITQDVAAFVTYHED